MASSDDLLRSTLAKVAPGTALRDGLDVSPVITHEFALDQAVQAVAVAGERGGGSSKVMLRLG